MRAAALFAALALVTAPVVAAPTTAYADGIERPQPPRRQPRPHRPRPAPVAPAPAVIERGPEEVTLPSSFFASAGGVGTDIGTGYVGGGTTVIVNGGGHASAFAFASASASARGRGGYGGHHGGGGGCGCH